MPTAVVESIDHEGRGIARNDGKAIFIDFALPSEVVEYTSYRRKNNYELAHLIKIIKPSPFRINPHCEYFTVCGGCVLQHFESSAQLASKQRVLEDSLWHIGRVKAQMILPPIIGKNWGYRHRARLSVKNVIKKNSLLIGFHERKSSYVADMQSCTILPPQVSQLLVPLRKLFASLDICNRLPQIEVAVGEKVLVIVLRILDSLSQADEIKIKQFIDNYNSSLKFGNLPLQFYLQSKGPESAVEYYPPTNHSINSLVKNNDLHQEVSNYSEQENKNNKLSFVPELFYSLEQFLGKNGNKLRFVFKPTEFTQVNFAVNRILVNKAMQLLNIQSGENIADFFCGLGNFTLPILSLGAKVIGVEFNEALIKRAYQQLELNGWDKNEVDFFAQNLFTITPEQLTKFGKFDKWLIDPPREGAFELIKALGECSKEYLPKVIVYISCNPATLARDSGFLVNVLGYKLRAAGIANMFPHTAHVESIAHFVL